jgi:CRP-like cAMP-binding protein
MAGRTHGLREADDDPRPRNRILAALPPEDFHRIAAHLKTVSISPRQILQKQGEPLPFVYFPNTGVCSITHVLSDGKSVETTTVGNEGIIGIEAFLTHDPIAPGETLIQVSDTTAERLTVEAFRRELAYHGTLFVLAGRYVQLAIAQMMQLAACNVVHQVQERCCRWLLMTQDRVNRADFALSHEILATMLGVRRQTVTLVAQALQHEGLIACSRGRITIVDRPGLESAACECYSAIRHHFERLSP